MTRSCRSKRRWLNQSTGLLVIATLVAMAGCEGDVGPAGAAGSNGISGTDGTSCTVTDNGDGTRTISCDDGTETTISSSACWDLDGSGTCDVATEDVNSDGVCDALDCTGPAGPVTTTNESCVVCHSAGKIADVAEMHPVSTASNMNITVTSLENAGGFPRVTVNLQDDSGDPIPAAAFEARRLSFTLSDLVPAGTDAGTSGTWDSDYFKRWASENLTTSGGTADLTDADNGNYVYTFATPFSTLGTAGTGNDDFSYTSASHMQRLVVEVRGLDSSAFNRSGKTFDFDGVPADGTAAAEIDSQRMFVTVDACKKCHGPTMDKAAHANSHPDTRICVTCHSPLYVRDRTVGSVTYTDIMRTEGVMLSQFIHKIHSAIDVAPFGTRILGNGYADVTYPKKISNCVVCHNNDSGAATGTGNLIDNWKDHPTMEICGSCHVNIDFAQTDNTAVDYHPGGPQSNNSLCGGCHPATGTVASKSVTEAHMPTVTEAYTTEVATNDPGADGYFAADDDFVVNITVRDSGGAVVDVGTSTAFNRARLYIYGPRNHAAPIIFPGSTTDPTYDGTSDATTNVDFVDADQLAANAEMSVDATGYHYTTTLPAGLAPGTYMIYAYVREAAGNQSHYTLDTFQVEDATPEVRVAGTGCGNCHEPGTAAHNDAFIETTGNDVCLACHNDFYHGVTIRNRVHAVHRAAEWGDLGNLNSDGTFKDSPSRDFSEITYPQDVTRCETCHNSGSTTYFTKPSMAPCAGCHVERDNMVIDHMRQSGGPY